MSETTDYAARERPAVELSSSPCKRPRELYVPPVSRRFVDAAFIRTASFLHLTPTSAQLTVQRLLDQISIPAFAPKYLKCTETLGKYDVKENDEVDDAMICVRIVSITFEEVQFRTVNDCPPILISAEMCCEWRSRTRTVALISFSPSFLFSLAYEKTSHSFFVDKVVEKKEVDQRQSYGDPTLQEESLTVKAFTRRDTSPV